MSLFINTNTTIREPQLYENILLNNLNQSINIVLSDIQINHKLIIERIHTNNYDCYVNTSRGNFILNKEDPRLHLIYYNQRWYSIGRDVAIPFLDQTDKQNIILHQFFNSEFGTEFFTTQNYTSNSGINNKYYISERMIVSANKYYQNEMGCLFVYSKDISTQEYTILEDIITINYNPVKGQYQGNFGTYFDLLDMNGYHYLIVCATKRKNNNSFLTIYIYSYRKRTDGTFYFQVETNEDELIVPSEKELKFLSVTPGKGFHLCFENELITYYLSTSNNVIRISKPYSINPSSPILDIQSTLSNVYLLQKSQITKYSFPSLNLNNDSLLNPTSYKDLSENKIRKFLIDSSGSFVYHSDDTIYFYTQNTEISFNVNPPTGVKIKSIDLYGSIQKIVYLLSNGDLYILNNTNSLTPKIGTISNLNYSKMKFQKDNSNYLYFGYPLLNQGKIYRVRSTNFEQLIIDNFLQNTSIPPQIFISDSAENIFLFDRKYKMIHVLSRNVNNIYALNKNILIDKTLKPHLRFRDTILDVKWNDTESQIVFGVLPYNDIKSYVLIVNSNDLSFLSKIEGTTVGYGTSIDIYRNTAVISDPLVPETIRSGVFYASGKIDIYNLKPNSNFNKKNLDDIRSTSPIGQLVKISPSLFELVSIGKDSNNIKSITRFSNIYDIQPKINSMNLNISEVEFFMNGKIILTNTNSQGKIYRIEKVNGCFDIVTNKEVLFDQTTQDLEITPLGQNYAVFHSQSEGKFFIYDIRDMTMIKSWTDSSFVSNVSLCIDGSTIAYANMDTQSFSFVICT
jgi:hypothetical protein